MKTYQEFSTKSRVHSNHQSNKGLYVSKYVSHAGFEPLLDMFKVSLLSRHKNGAVTIIGVLDWSLLISFESICWEKQQTVQQKKKYVRNSAANLMRTPLLHACM